MYFASKSFSLKEIFEPILYKSEAHSKHLFYRNLYLSTKKNIHNKECNFWKVAKNKFDLTVEFIYQKGV